jgi:hypothetical protein
MLIGIGHRTGHGKDTFALMLQEILGPDKSQIVPFARKMKDVAVILYGHLGLREEAYYNTPEGRRARNRPLPEINLTPVEIWVGLGESVRNGVWHPTWVSLMQHQSKGNIVISPDTRHFNEIERCDIKVKIVNPRVENRKGASIDDNLEGYTSWDKIVINDGTLEDLRQKATDFVSEYNLATDAN